ncbi:MAG: hypothetical protein OEU54_08515 [Gemmatimonadota bacterium]|nr:hypothetical protein [Gemmatimonadota bacterium]
MSSFLTADPRPALVLASLLVAIAACGGASPPAGLGDEAASLEYIDGPADHVGGTAIPPFTVWVLDRFGRRATGIPGGTLTLDLLGPGGDVQQTGFASVPASFGQAVVTPTTSLAPGVGYSVRGRFQGVTEDSPPFAVVAAADVIEMTNPSTGEVGLLIDGENNIGRLADITLRTTQSEVDAGVFDSRGFAQATAIFAPDRRPELIPITWTAGIDRVPVALQDRIALPVTVWVVGGTFAAEKTKVEDALAELNERWRQERAGVVMSDIQFMDATPLANPFETFAIGIGAPFQPLQDNVGRAAGRFNIYVVTTIRVNQMDVNGFAEQGGTAVAVTSVGLLTAPARVIGHELGHNFGLQDAPTGEGFAGESNMMAVGQFGTAFTEGQIFRAHFNQFSGLRGLRTGDTFGALACPPVDATTDCPELALRIWTEAETAVSSAPRGAGGRR